MALIRAPRWLPRLRPRRAAAPAARIRQLLAQMTNARAAQIAAGMAPDDLATKIMTTADPQTGRTFDAAEMADQVAIFFLAGHETSASALAWALYLLAIDPEAQARVAEEVAALSPTPRFEELSRLRFTRNVFRETLRLYPPVPMMVREAAKPARFRDRDVAPGSLCILSPWHLHRHERLWPDPHVFDPDRWGRDETATLKRDAYMPFSKGPRVCTGAGFAMMEGVLLLAMLVRAFHITPDAARVPRPVTHLTVRAHDGIWLTLAPRNQARRLKT